MAVIKLLTSEAVTRYYLYSQDAVPSNIVDDNLIRPLDATTTIEVHKNEFMSTAGRFAIGSQFELIKRFFFDVFGESDQTRLFSKQELADRYGISDFGWDMQQLNIRNGIDDYTERGASHFCEGLNDQRFIKIGNAMR